MSVDRSRGRLRAGRRDADDGLDRKLTIIDAAGRPICLLK
jgi:hypothetical protein